MNTLWILAALNQSDIEQPEGEIITSEEVGSQTTENMTQADGSQTPDAGDGEPTKPPAPPWMQYLPFILLFVVMYMFLFRGPKKKQQAHQKMEESLQKNDRVRTIGGILGTIIDVRDDEIVLKVDESNNTKLHIARGAISKVVSGETD
jgi:preprotein translocase subunit YajC